MPEMVDALRDYEQVTRAIRAFEAGGRITNMTVSAVPALDAVIDPNKPPLVMISSIGTADLDYPPQMIEVIKTQLMERQKKIADELAGLGVIVPTEINETA